LADSEQYENFLKKYDIIFKKTKICDSDRFFINPCKTHIEGVHNLFGCYLDSGIYPLLRPCLKTRQNQTSIDIFCCYFSRL